MRKRFSALAVTAAVAVVPALAPATVSARSKSKSAHKGQFCSPHKKAPKGFKCKKSGKSYRLS